MVAKTQSGPKGQASGKPPLYMGLINLRSEAQRKQFFDDGWSKVYGTADKPLQLADSRHPIPVSLLSVDRDPEGGLLGCTRSHVEIYRRALQTIDVEDPRACAIVFEDDVQITGAFTAENIKECMDLMAYWDVIRLHKTGICKVHGKLSPSVYHASSLCGRGYFISARLMKAVVAAADVDNCKSIVPYTYYLAQVSARQLTVSSPAMIREGAYGSHNAAGFGNAQGMAKALLNPMTLLQHSLNYTTAIEQTVASVSFYANLTSPLYTTANFPVPGESFTSVEGAAPIKTPLDYRRDVGDYEALENSSLIPELVSSLFGGGERKVTSNIRQSALQKGKSALGGAAAKTKPDFDAVVIGGGVSGASNFYWLSKECKDATVCMLDQFDEKSRPAAGSSGTGGRRIGILDLAPGHRVRRAWDFWLDFNEKAKLENKDERILDVLGEVISVKLFPIGWLLLIFFLIWNAFRSVLGGSMPRKIDLLWTKHAILSKWPGKAKEKMKAGLPGDSVGVYYPEAATFHANKCVEYLWKEGKKEGGTIKTGVTVQQIELQQGGAVRLTCVDASGKALELTAGRVVVCAGAWSGPLLDGLQLEDGYSLSAKSKIGRFACPVYQMGKGHDLLDKPAPIFSMPSEQVYGFYVFDGKNMFIRCNTAFEEVPFDKDSKLPGALDVKEHLDNSCVKAVQTFALKYKLAKKGSKGPDTLYECRYPMLAVKLIEPGAKGKVADPSSCRQLMDFVPHSSDRLIVCSGFDGYGFKYGSIIGLEILELLGGGAPPKGLEWCKEDAEAGIMRFLHSLIDSLLKSTGSQKGGVGMGHVLLVVVIAFVLRFCGFL